MRTLFRISLPLIAVIMVVGVFAAPASADGARSDHALYFDLSTPADTAIYCGVAANGDSRKAYTLHISGTASDSAGSFFINFLDEDVMEFRVPANSTVSTTQALGGVPGVDTTVKITAKSGVHSMMASVLAGEEAKDPFTGDGRNNNFCVTINANGTDNNGLTIKLTTPHPATWDTAGHLN